MIDRIGIFGGTFDPIHLGHMRLAQTAKSELGLDRMIMMPNYVSPFKLDKKVSPAEDRVAMVKAAIEGLPGFEISTWEIENEGASYTYDTLDFFEKQFNGEMYFLVGFDSLVQLDKWYRGPEILSRFHIVAGRRPGTDDTEGYEKIVEFEKLYGARIHLLDIEPFDVSSTEIREMSAGNQSLDGLVPEGVERYIKEHVLYG